MSALRRLLLAVSFCTTVAAALPARAADYTDIWFVPAESGWGVNVVQSDNFLFLTFFIYDANGKPTWFAGNLTWDGNAYTGGLYLTQGTYYAAPWNPAAYAATQVGTATFLPGAQNSDQATLSYTVNGVGTVTKAVERQTLTTIALGGNYFGGQSGTYSSCTNPADNETYSDKYSLAVAQGVGGAATFTFTYDSGSTCVLSGTLEQHGKQYRIPSASYQCSGNLNYSVTAAMDEIRATVHGIEARFSATLPGACQENANVAAVLLF